MLSCLISGNKYWRNASFNTQSRTRTMWFVFSTVGFVLPARATDEPVWDFIQTGIRLAFPSRDDEALPSDVWNCGLVRAVLGSFPSECFDDMGTFKSLRRIRIERDGESFLPASLWKSSVINDQREPEPRQRLNFTALKHRIDQKRD